MAVLAIRQSHDPKAVVDAFATTTAETSDYLANEVIARLPPDLTDFLARISVLEEFDADLCEAVTGETQAQSLVERIVANDLFVYRLDLAGERYRFHQMFAAYLRTVLKSKGDAAYKDAQRRAGDAMYTRGDRLGALRHAMAIADVQRAAAIVTDSIATILEVDDAPQAMTVARAWLARFGADALHENTEQYLQSVFLLATGGQREAERWLIAFDQAHPTPAPGIAAFAHATWSNLHLNRGNAEASLTHNTLAADAADKAAARGITIPQTRRAATARGSGLPLDWRPGRRRRRTGAADTAADLTDRRRGPLARRAPVDPVPSRRPGIR